MAVLLGSLSLRNKAVLNVYDMAEREQASKIWSSGWAKISHNDASKRTGVSQSVVNRGCVYAGVSLTQRLVSLLGSVESLLIVGLPSWLLCRFIREVSAVEPSVEVLSLSCGPILSHRRSSRVAALTPPYALFWLPMIAASHPQSPYSPG
jgi:hypothetical protein